MLFIGGISQGRKLLNYARSIFCQSCGSTSQCQVFMTYMYFSFFFIPLFKWNKRFYVQMSCCSAIYELEPEIGKAILRGEEPSITSATFIWSRRENTPAPGRKVPEIPIKSVCAADLRQMKITITAPSAGDGSNESKINIKSSHMRSTDLCILHPDSGCNKV